MKEKLVLPCLRGVIGDWVYYSSLMTASQIRTHIKAAKDIRESKTLDEYLQRDLKDRRKEIAKYLLTKDSRFFNSIVIGVFDGVPDWFEFEIKRQPKLTFSDQDFKNLKDSVGFLVFNGDEDMFAIDGQHRVAGIAIAGEKDEEQAAENQVLSEDQFSVIFLAHLDDDSGRKRTRKLFSDINKNAKPVAEGDKIKIDEEDLSAIVTRRVYAEYPLFKGGELISLTETAKLDNNDEKYFTNLLALYSVNKKLKPLFKKKISTDDWHEVNVLAFKEIVFEFYDFIFKSLDEYKSYFFNKTLDLKTTREKNKYILFRPVGLVLLARLYTYFRKKGDLQKLRRTINKIGFVMPDSPYNKVLWDDGKMEAKMASQTIAYNLTLYLLKEYPEGDHQNLLKKYKEITKNNRAKLPPPVVKK